MARIPKPKPTYTFSDGTTVTIERVGPMLPGEIAAENPAPQPPLAPGFEGKLEPNPADPDYQAALVAHEQRLMVLIMDAMIDCAISDDVEIDQQAVARIRRTQTARGKDLGHMTDKVVYIKYVLLSDGREFEQLFKMIADYDHPGEGMIETAENGFHGTIQGEGPPADQAAPVRGPLQQHLRTYPSG